MRLILAFVAVFYLGTCDGLPHIREDEKIISVPVIPDSPTQVIVVSPEKSQLLSDVKQILLEMDKTTVAPTEESMSTISPTETVTAKTRKTKKPQRARPTKDRPLLNLYLDALTSTAAPTPAPTPSAANPNLGTYITNIENLQIALSGMASDIDTLCDDKKTQGTLDPLRNPFIQFLQNITQQQANLTNTVLQYWATAPGLALQPLSLTTVTLAPLPNLFAIKSEGRKNSNDEKLEIDEKLHGLEMAIKTTIEEMLPHMRYIEEFPSETASTEEWEKFNDSIEFVATRLRNKTIQQVLDKEKTVELLENYEKYLSALSVVRLYRDMENGKETTEAIIDAVKTRKGC